MLTFLYLWYYSLSAVFCYSALFLRRFCFLSSLLLFFFWWLAVVFFCWSIVALQCCVSAIQQSASAMCIHIFPLIGFWHTSICIDIDIKCVPWLNTPDSKVLELILTGREERSPEKLWRYFWVFSWWTGSFPGALREAQWRGLSHRNP